MANTIELAIEALAAVKALKGARAHRVGCDCSGLDQRFQRYTCGQSWLLVDEAYNALSRHAKLFKAAPDMRAFIEDIATYPDARAERARALLARIDGD